MSNYPFKIDSDVELIRVEDGSTELSGDAINSVRDAVLAVEKTIGTNPQGNMPDLTTRINSVIDSNGQIKTSALQNKGLITLPITDAHISSTAGIKEGKLSLNYSTTSLNSSIQSAKSDIVAVRNAHNDLSARVSRHFVGDSDLHTGSDILLVNAINGFNTVEEALHDVSDSVSNHLNSLPSHNANTIAVNDNFDTFSATNVQSAINNLESSVIQNIINHSKEQHGNVSVFEDNFSEQINLSNTSFAATIFQTDTAKAPNILCVMRPNVARVTSKNINLSEIKSGSNKLRIQVGGVDRDYLDIDLSGVTEKYSIDALVEIINSTLHSATNHYPVSAYNTNGKLTIAHNIPGYEFTLKIMSDISNSAHSALGFEEIVDQIITWSGEANSCFISGKKIFDFNSIVNTTKTLSSSSDTIDFDFNLEDLGVYGNSKKILVNITNHSSDNSANGTYYITSFPAPNTIVLNYSIPDGSFDIEISNNAINFTDSSNGELYDIFMEASNLDGYGQIYAYKRANYNTSSNINLRSLSLGFPTQNVEYSIAEFNKLKILVNSESGTEQQITTGFKGQIEVFAPDNINSAIFELTGMLTNGDNQINVYDFNYTSDAVYIASVHHAGNYGPKSLKLITDKRNFAVEEPNYELKELRNNGILNGFDIISKTASTIKVRGGKALVDGKILNIPTQILSVSDFTEDQKVIVIDRNGNFVVKNSTDLGYSVSNLVINDGYGDLAGVALVAEFKTNGTQINTSSFIDRRLLINKIDKKVYDLNIRIDDLNEKINDLEETITFIDSEGTEVSLSSYVRYYDGKVGIGNTNPVEKLDVTGAIKIGDTTELNNGTIRWTGSDFQGYKSGSWVSLTSQSITDHGLLTGNSDDDHSQYALLTGRSSGQSLNGGNESGGTLTLSSTSDSTKGKILFGTSVYDETNNRLGIGTSSPSTTLDVNGAIQTTRLTSTQTTGTAPFTVSSTTIVTNLNADLLDGNHSSAFALVANGVTNGNYHDHSDGDGGQINHGGTAGLSDDDHTQYLLLAGRTGGQTVYGGTASSNNITISSTSNATKGKILFGSSSGFNEATNRLGIGTNNPSYRLTVTGSGSNNGCGWFENTSTKNFILCSGRDTPSTNYISEFIAEDGVTGEVFSLGLIGTAYAALGGNVGDLGINVSGFERIRVSKTTGNVGIGTITPQNKLDVEGAVAIGASYSGSYIAPTDGLIVAGKVGIGTTSIDTYAKTQIGPTTSLVWGNVGGMLSVYRLNPEENYGSAIGGRVAISSGSAGNPSMGIYGEGQVSGNFDYGDIAGGTFNAVVEPGGGYTVTHAEGLSTYSEMRGAGTVTNLYGAWICGNSKLSGTVTNNYGIYIGDQSGVGTNNWQIYSDGTAPTYFGGNVGIKNENPSVSLDVVGNTSVSGTLTVGGDISNKILSETFQVIRQALDGYTTSTGSTADGYITFFTGTNKIAGDNDLYWDRVNNRLGIHTTSPISELSVNGKITIPSTTTALTWSTMNEISTDYSILTSVAYGNEKWVAVGFKHDGSGTRAACSYSADGKSWSAPAYFNETSGKFYSNSGAVAYDSVNNLWVAAFIVQSWPGNPRYLGISTSSNGSTWSNISLVSSSLVSDSPVDHMLAHDGIGRWQLVLNNGSGQYNIFTSTNGTSWSELGWTGSNTYIKSVCWDATNSKWVAVGYKYSTGRPCFITSTNGTSWSAASEISTSLLYLNSIAYYGGKVVAVGTGADVLPYVIYSTNAANWSAFIPISSYKTADNLVSVAGYSGGWVITFGASSDNGRYPCYATSSDGITWSSSTNITTNSTQLFSVAATNTLIVTVGRNMSNNRPIDLYCDIIGYNLYIANSAASSISSNFGFGNTNSESWIKLPSNASSVSHKIYGGSTNLFTITGAGKVRIGTGSPANNLDIYGSSDQRIHIESTGANSHAGISFYNDAQKWLIQNQGSDGDKLLIYDETAVQPRFVITAITGNIGIGTAGPVNKLDVAGSVAIGSSYSGSYTAPTNGLIVQGNVGIGIPNPAAGNWSPQNNLHIKSSTGTPAGMQIEPTNSTYVANINLATYGNGKSIADAGNKGWQISARGENIGWSDAQQGDMVFGYWSGSSWVLPILFLDKTGKVGIGTDSPSSKLEIIGNTNIIGDLLMGGSTSDFPSLGRLGTGLSVKLADNSAFANITAAGFVATPDGYVGFQNRSEITSPVNGNLLLTNEAGSDFGLLQFGGTTNAYPALKRSAAAIEARLADDSNYAEFTSSTINSSANIIAAETGFHGWSARSLMYSPADGKIKFTNNAGTNFSLLQLGGTTSDYPALGRLGTGLSVKLADDSAFANITAAGFVATPDGYVGFQNRSEITSPVNGNLLLTNEAGSDFGLLQFGGTSSSYPALKRSTTQIHARLADDSAYADFYGQTIYANANIQLASGSNVYWTGRSQINSPADGKITLYNNTGNNFSILQFGGTTNAYPALKRSGTILISRLADDSGLANFQASVGYFQTLQLSAGSYIYNSSDGTFRLTNNAGNNFSLLQFGGTTNAYPALKRNNADLHVRLADDSSYANIYVAGIYNTGGYEIGSGSSIYWATRSRMYSPADGQIRLTNSALNDFSMLQFGGTSSSYPALKRSTTQIHARLADDSAYADFYGQTIYANANIQLAGGSNVYWTGRSQINSPADGKITLYNNTGNDFSLLQFGGTTNQFPAIKRIGTSLHFRAADDSDYASIACETLDAYGPCSIKTDDTGTGTVNYLVFKDVSGSTTGVIATTGGVLALSDSSDIRYKENIKPTEINACNVLNKIDLISFNYVDSDHHHEIGFNAQQLQEIIPDAVGEVDGDLFVNRSALVPYLVKAVKELTEKVNELTEKLNILENK